MSENQAVHPQPGLQAPTAPSREETVADPRKTLQWISDRLAQIYSLPTPATPNVNRAAYSSIYTTVWNYCFATKDARRSRQVTIVTGKDLYLNLEQAIRAYCRESLEHITTSGTAEGASGIPLAYMEQWVTFLHLNGLVTHLFHPLEDRWIRREIAEAAEDSPKGHGQTHHIPELHAIVWREEVLKGSTKIMDAMVAMQQRDQKSEDNEKALREFCASLNRVGLALSDGRLTALDQ